jgi:hypothetical protein
MGAKRSVATDNNAWEEGTAPMELIHAPSEVATAIGSFYTGRKDPVAAVSAVHCDCVECREQQQQRPLFEREPK